MVEARRRAITSMAIHFTLMRYIRLLVVFILPPVAMYMTFGANKYFWLNCLLTLLGFFPGLLHAMYIMAARPPGLGRVR
jgi:uncharacterized membrane protein YqaE (UPF0057 family)